MDDTILACRFWAKVEQRAANECWPWIGSHFFGQAYGQMRVAGKLIRANRLAFYVANGYWPNYACHTCDNGNCCNPSHIYDGTHATNMADKKIRNRQWRPKGTLHGEAKLTDDAVRAIRASATSGPVLAKEYGVSKTLIYRVKHRLAWVHVI